MKVVIFCGGLGTRLREETEFRPKPMVEIGGKPVLWHIMKIYASFGFKEFVLALGYKGELIREYFFNYELHNCDFTLHLGDRNTYTIHDTHDEKDWSITLAETGEATLKGGRLKKIEKFIDTEDFLLTYGDGVADIDIEKSILFHKSHGKIATLTGVNPSARFGELNIEGETIRSFSEKPEKINDYVNGGFFVLNRKIFNYLVDEPECDFENNALAKLAKDDQLMLHRHNGFWACMDTLRDRDYLINQWDSGKAPWKIW